MQKDLLIDLKLRRIGKGSEKEKEAQGLFSFLPKIEVLSRTSLEVLQDILVLTIGMWNLATGVQLNGCADLWVCS